MKISSIFFAIILFIQFSECKSDDLNMDLTLYVTSSDLVFGMMGGCTIPESYHTNKSGSFLDSQFTGRQRANWGLYDSSGVLFLSAAKQFHGHQFYKLGDTLVPYNASNDSSLVIQLYNPKLFSERLVSISEYVFIKMNVLSQLHKPHKDYKKMRVLLNPDVIDQKLIAQIDSTISRFDYVRKIDRVNYEPGNAQIKEFRKYNEASWQNALISDSAAISRYRVLKMEYAKQKAKEGRSN